MRPIQMVDLQTQYQRIKPEIDAAIQEVIDNATFVKGRQVGTFARHLEQWLTVKHVVPTGNGTDALQIALMALGLKQGDEVITPDFTFIATAEVVALLGLTPVVVDVAPDTMNISVEAIRKSITKRTKAIVPVHLFGQCADMEAIMQIAKEHNLYVVEDACQAIGAEYLFSNGTRKKAGCIGHIGCTSFFPSKNLGCYGDGGAIFTDDDELAERMQAIANHGMVVRYHHDIVGVNSRLDSIQAAILDVKLHQLDEYTTRRKHTAEVYDKGLADLMQLQTPARAPYSTHVFHQYTLQLKAGNRDALHDALAVAGIPTMVYYPVPIHKQKAYSNQRYKESDFSVSNKLSKCVLSLPMHTELDEEQLEYIIGHIHRFMHNI